MTRDVSRRGFLAAAATLSAGAVAAPALAQQGFGLWGGGKELPNFPVYRQPDDISCGPTCCSMVLAYYGISAGIGPLKTRAGTRFFSAGDVQVGLTVPAGMERALESYGLPASIYRGSLDSVVRYIDQGRPPILLVRSAGTLFHYFTAIGYMHGTSYIRIADPSGNKYWMRGGDLNALWQYSHGMGNYQYDNTVRANVLTAQHIENRRCRTCGGSGKMTNLHCPLCGGDGQIEVKIAGRVVGRTKCSCNGGRITKSCVPCGGDGRETDWHRKAVEMAGVSGHTLIVPDRAPAGNRPSSPGTQPSGNQPSGNQPSGGNPARIDYTLWNDSGRDVRFRLPSGNTYTLKPGERGKYYATGSPSAWKIYVFNSSKEYTLVSGDHKFWWMRDEGRVGFDKNYRK